MSRLVLVRHGESIWNLQNRFTGWVDVSLSQNGMVEAQRVGELLARERFDVAFSSALLRAQDTLYEILKQNHHCQHYVRVHEQSSDWYEHFTPAEGDAAELKIYVSEKLNERYYGDLQGLDKAKVRAQFGVEEVHRWRRSYDVPPPNGESLQMTAARTLPYYRNRIERQLRTGKTVLVSAHGNSLRAIVMLIENMTPERISKYEIATGTSHIYDFDARMQLIKKQIRDYESSPPL